MEEQILAFLAGAVLGCVLLFAFLLILAASDSDPDNW